MALLLPVMVVVHHELFIVAMMFLISFGFANLVVFTVITAIYDSHVYKLSVYVFAICLNLYVFLGLISYALIEFVATVLIFGLFYFIFERKRTA
jgi:hypothetical protein